MNALYTALKSRSVVYVTRDIERAIGLPLATEGYFIISNHTPFAKSLADQHENIFLVENDQLLDTHELLNHPDVTSHINTLVHPSIVVFKNSTRIESICAKQGWPLLNPPAALANTVEQKISQIEWLGELTDLLPNHKITTPTALSWTSAPLIIQYNHAHTGTGTRLIQDEDELKALQSQFPDRPIRVSDYITGPVFTSNNIVGSNNILTGPISYQITGLAPFTDNPFATVGNDWGLPQTLLTDAQQAHMYDIARTIGTKLQRDGWRGAFGIDVILDNSTNTLKLIEINARQPASVTYESQLQKNTEKTSTLSTFEAHISALLGISLAKTTVTPVTDGAQIVQRVTDEVQSISPKPLATLAGLTLTPYTSTKHGAELLRIQSPHSLMSAPNQLNALGTDIKNTLHNV